MAHVVVCVCFGIFLSEIYFVLDSTWKLKPSSLSFERRAAWRLWNENSSSLLFILSLYHLIWSHVIIWTSHYAHKYNLLHPRTAVIVICDRLVGSSSCIRSPAAPVGLQAFVQSWFEKPLSQWQAFNLMCACSASWLIKLPPMSMRRNTQRVSLPCCAQAARRGRASVRHDRWMAGHSSANTILYVFTSKCAHFYYYCMCLLWIASARKHVRNLCQGQAACALMLHVEVR